VPFLPSRLPYTRSRAIERAGRKVKQLPGLASFARSPTQQPTRNQSPNSAHHPMNIEQLVPEKSAEALLDKAEECFDLAKTQQNLADKQL
jgi:hypothetical protein